MKRIVLMMGIMMIAGSLEAMSAAEKALGVASIVTGVQSVRDICVFKVRNFTSIPYYVNIRDKISDLMANMPGAGFKVVYPSRDPLKWVCFETGLLSSKRIWLRTSPSRSESEATYFDLNDPEIKKMFSLGIPYEATIWKNSRGLWLILKGRHQEVFGLIERYIAIRHDAAGKLIIKDLGPSRLKSAATSRTSTAW